MKTRIIILFFAFVFSALMAEAQLDYTCPRCNGKGYIEKYDMVRGKYKLHCTRCNGKGETKHGRPIKPYGQEQDDYNWESFLTPEEKAVVANIQEQLQSFSYDYQTCKYCNGTGVCPKCQGSNPVTVYSDGCSQCNGSGMCFVCGGRGYTDVTVKENPNTDQLRQQLAEYMRLGNERQAKLVAKANGYGDNQTPDAMSNGDDWDSDEDDYYFEKKNNYSSKSSDTTIWVILGVVVLVIIIIFRRKKKS